MVIFHFTNKDNLKIVKRPNDQYHSIRTEQWFKEPRILTFAKEIDGAEYVGSYIFKNREGLPILDTQLSTGFKMLAMIYMNDDPELVYLTSRLGDNCWEHLAGIQDLKDIHMFVNSPIFWLSRTGLKIRAFEDNRLITNSGELDKAIREIGGY